MEDAPISASTTAMLESIDPAELAASDLPRLLKASDRLESHAAAKKATVIAGLAHECREFKGWDDQDPTANETSVALAGAARPRARGGPPQQATAHPPPADTRHVARRAHHQGARAQDALRDVTARQDKCAQVEDIALPGAEHLSVAEFATRSRAVAKVHTHIIK